MNDNLFKNALVMLITYRIGENSGYGVSTLLSMQTALFILPYFLFSALAGQIADKYPKAVLAQWIKLIEIGLAILAAAGMVMGSLWFMFFVLFLFGTHSAFFGPIKYAILPELLSERELLAGNGLIEAGTLIAILFGTIAAGLFTLMPYGAEFVGASVCMIAYIGYWVSKEIPIGAAINPDLKIDWNIFADTAKILNRAAKNRDVFASILTISWFWFIGAAFVTLLPAMVKYQIHANQEVITYLFVLFSVGIAIGSVLCSKIMRDRIGTSIVPVAALGVSVFSIDLWWVVTHYAAFSDIAGLGEFLRAPDAIRITADLLLLTLSGGVFIVPLYTILQSKSESGERARMLAANNIVNAMFMVASSLASLQLMHLQFSIAEIFAIYGIINLIIGAMIAWRWRI